MSTHKEAYKVYKLSTWSYYLMTLGEMFQEVQLYQDV